MSLVCGFFSYELLMCVFPISDERELVNRLNDSIIDFLQKKLDFASELRVCIYLQIQHDE